MCGVQLRVKGLGFTVESDVEVEVSFGAAEVTHLLVASAAAEVGGNHRQMLCGAAHPKAEATHPYPLDTHTAPSLHLSVRARVEPSEAQEGSTKQVSADALGV